VAAAFGFGAHASTFGGTPLVTAAALETLKIMDEEKIVDRARDTGIYFKDALKQLKQRHSRIVEVRGKGLLLGIQLDGPADGLVAGQLHAKGLSGQLRAGGYPAFRTAVDHPKKEIDLLIQCLDEVLTQ
jgi:acetylornithine/N-succinyldiaminopimelate aminotransferase